MTRAQFDDGTNMFPMEILDAALKRCIEGLLGRTNSNFFFESCFWGCVSKGPSLTLGLPSTGL